MKTIEVPVYKYSELDDEAKEKAINDWLSHGLDYDWWEYLVEDAKDVGIVITDFRIEHFANGHFNEYPVDVAKNILDFHGNSSETYKTAERFLADFDGLDDDEAVELLEEEFKRDILEDYRILLMHEYEYQNSEEAIGATLEANEYDFLENGEMVPGCIRIC